MIKHLHMTLDRCVSCVHACACVYWCVCCICAFGSINSFANRVEKFQGAKQFLLESGFQEKNFCLKLPTTDASEMEITDATRRVLTFARNEASLAMATSEGKERPVRRRMRCSSYF